MSTGTSYFDPVWNTFSHANGSMRWIPKQIVSIGEDFQSQVDDVAFKESHAKDVEKLTADRLCEAEKKTKDTVATLRSILYCP